MEIVHSLGVNDLSSGLGVLLRLTPSKNDELLSVFLICVGGAADLSCPCPNAGGGGGPGGGGGGMLPPVTAPSCDLARSIRLCTGAFCNEKKTRGDVTPRSVVPKMCFLELQIGVW